jgi:IS1 family transposase
VNRGNQKACRIRRQYNRCRIGSQSNRNDEGSRRGFDFRSTIEEEISGDQKARGQQKDLAVYPVGQEPVQQPREVVFALLCPIDVLLCERYQDSLFTLWRSASALAFPAPFRLLLHLKKYISFLLTSNEYVYILSIVKMNMDNRRLSKEKQVFVLAAISEGTPIRAIARMLKTEKYVITRIIRETGAAFADYMDAEFRDLPCARIEMDEQWQYVGIHAGRMPKPKNLWEKRDQTRGDFWLWACIDADTKLVFSHKIGKRDYWTGREFVEDVRERVTGAVQIATDNYKSYPSLIRGAFGYEGFSYGTETKIFGDPEMLDGTLARFGRNEGVRKMVTAERKAVVGSPILESLTTSHIERVFLSVRQELKRFQRKGLGYSKDLETHKVAVALHLGIYNFARKHTTLGTTPAVAAGVELEPWGLERVVEMTAEYLRRKEDAKFEDAFAKIGC